MKAPPTLYWHTNRYRIGRVLHIDYQHGFFFTEFRDLIIHLRNHEAAVVDSEVEEDYPIAVAITPCLLDCVRSLVDALRLATPPKSSHFGFEWGNKSPVSTRQRHAGQIREWFSGSISPLVEGYYYEISLPMDSYVRLISGMDLYGSADSVFIPHYSRHNLTRIVLGRCAWERAWQFIVASDPVGTKFTTWRPL